MVDASSTGEIVNSGCVEKGEEEGIASHGRREEPEEGSAVTCMSMEAAMASCQRSLTARLLRSSYLHESLNPT